MRLLTEEEIKVAKCEGHREWIEAVKKDPNNQELLEQEPISRAIAEAQRDLTHKETLKAVGSYLNERHPDMSLTELGNFIDCLLRGEMPAKDTKADPPMPSKQKAREKCLGKLLD